MTKKIIRALAFFLVLALVYGAVDTVLKIKTYDMHTLHALNQMEEGTVDVVIVGSSHAGLNIDNRQIWYDTGIATYNAWSGMQPIWNSYYFLKECIAAQKPKIALVDVYLAGMTIDYSTKLVALKNIASMPWGGDKVKAAFASFENWQDAVEALWGMPYYHNRFDEITTDDLAGSYGVEDDGLPTVHHTVDTVTPINMLTIKRSPIRYR